MFTRTSLALVALLTFAPGAWAATFTVTTNAPAGIGSLRQAILDANASPGADTIAFNIAVGSPTIAPTNALPVLTDPVTIDGSTQPGFASAPLIEITGTNAGGFVNGFVIATNNCVIRALAINNFRGDNYLTGDAIQITNGSGSRVEGCYLGVARDGFSKSGNAGAGVRIGHPNFYFSITTSNHVIGGEATAAHNLISGNSYGVYILYSSGNTVLGNRIGTDATGTLDVGNTNSGIYISDSLTAFNLIGGTNAGARNLISGNGEDPYYYNADGVTIYGGVSNAVFGNFIGVDVTGTLALPNGQHGVNIRYGSANLIGGPATGQSNLISGNLANGVNLGGNSEAALATYSGTPPPLPEGNIVQGNLIGTDITGQLPIPNENDGVFIANMQGNLVGGFAAGEGNVISANLYNGVEITSYSTANNQVAGNLIGVTRTGALPLGNGYDGVQVNSINNFIGGTNAGAGNVIAYNANAGVNVNYYYGIAILGNSIYANTNLGIDLGSDGVTLNDPGDSDGNDGGANTFQNFPVLGQPVRYPTTTVITGTLNSFSNAPYRIELFHSVTKDANGYGQGRDYLGYVNAPTDGAGNASFNFTNGVSYPFGDVITATATDTNGNTSEFSLARRVVTPDSIDLVLMLTDSVDPAPRAASFFYTLSVTNYGPTNASGVVATATLPAGLSFVSAVASQGSCSQSAGVVTGNLGSLANGAGAIIIITVNGTNAGQVFTTASVAANETENEPDNNSASETTFIGMADTGVRTSDSTDPVTAGQSVTYTVIATNAGPDSATGATLNFSVDGNSYVTGAGVSQGTFAQYGNYFSCSIGTLPVNGSATLTVTAIPTAVGMANNYADISSPESDPDSANNTTNETTTVLAGPGILQFTCPTFATNENAGAAVISVQRLGGAIGNVTADFATSNLTALAGSDYTATNGTLTFTNGETLKNFLVRIIDDALPECNEDVRQRLFNPTGGAIVLVQTNALLQIFDNELTPAGVVQGVSLAVENFITTGNNISSQASITDDGRYVAFSSYANNLVITPPDANGGSDIFLFDRTLGTNRLVSLNTNGMTANNYSGQPHLSADGTRLIFQSYASDLTTNVNPGNYLQLFARDLATGLNQLISININGGGGGNNSADSASVSSNGLKIAFSSDANDLVVGDLNNKADVFFRDLASAACVLVSVNTGGNNPGNGFSDIPQISADGRYVVFRSTGSNLTANDANTRYDIFRRDLVGGITTLVSVNTGGNAGNNWSYECLISGNGRYVAFSSYDTDLTPGASFNQNIYLRDMTAGTTTLVSVNNSNVAANSGCNLRGLSRDGRYVLFESYASNLTTNDATSTQDIFLRDTVAGTTTLVSVNPPGTASGNVASTDSALSPDGRYVTFASSATDLVATGKQFGVQDIFTRDLQTGVTTLLTTRYGGSTGGNSDGYEPVISANGVAAFFSLATDLAPADENYGTDVFARAPGASAPELLSRAVSVTANNYSYDEHISLDGTKVAYVSYASNLVRNDTNGLRDVFLRDLLTGTNQLISVNAANNASGPLPADQPCVSTNGHYVAYHTGQIIGESGETQGDVYLRDTVAGTNMLVSVNLSGTGGGNSDSHDPEITPDGRFIVFGSKAGNLIANDVNGALSDVFLRNRTNAAVELISRNAAGTGSANGQSDFPTVSDDGRYVAFESIASDLGPADSNNHYDIYVRDRQTGSNILCSPNLTGTNGGNADSRFALISGGGRYVAFVSDAINLVAGDNNGSSDIFVFDLITRSLQLVSRTAGGVPGNGYSDYPSISADGRYVAFSSTSTNLVANDSNGDYYDVFVRDLIAGTTTLVSVTCDGTRSGNGFSYNPQISAAGRYIAFESHAPDLASGDFSAATENIYRRDQQAGTTVLVSQSSAYTGGGNQHSYNTSISANGSAVAFLSAANNLISGDANGFDDVFAWNAAPPGGFVDLALDKSAAVPEVAQSASFIYTLTVTNRGTATASSVVVTDALPATVTFVSASATQGGAVNSSGLVTWNVGSLAANAGARLSLTVTANTAGYVTNSANAAAAETDFIPGNNNDSVIVLITGTAPPTLSATVTNGNQLFLSWPYPSSGYSLESTTNLAPVSVWMPVPDLVFNNGLINFLLLNVNTVEPARFYQLRHP